MLIVCLFVWVFFFGVCVCLDYSRTNNRSLFKNLWVGPDWRKKLLKERSGSYFGYIKNHDFSEVPFQCILMTLAFYFIFLWRLIYMFGFILYHLRDWSHGVEHFALSECILLLFIVYLHSAKYLHIGFKALRNPSNCTSTSQALQ